MHPWAGLAKTARRFSQFEFKVGELRFPIHFVCVSAALYHRGYAAAIFPLGEYGPFTTESYYVIVIAPYGARQVVIAYSCVCVGHEGRPRAAGPRATRVTCTHAATRNNHLSSIKGDN